MQPRPTSLSGRAGALRPRFRRGADLRRGQGRQAPDRQGQGDRRQGPASLAQADHRHDDPDEGRRGPAPERGLPQGHVPARRGHVRHPGSGPGHARGRLPALLRAARRPARLAHQPGDDRPGPLQHHRAPRDDPVALRPRPRPYRIAPQDRLREARADQGGRRPLPGRHQPLLGRASSAPTSGPPAAPTPPSREPSATPGSSPLAPSARSAASSPRSPIARPTRRPRSRTVQTSVPVLLDQFAEATTPACPRGTKLISGGFSSEGATNLFSDGGHFNAAGTWTAGAFGYFGAASSFTAYGYCAKG